MKHTPHDGAVPVRVVARYFLSLTATDDGCWESSLASDAAGYSKIGWSEGGVSSGALGHQVAFYARHGYIPTAPMTIDHICRNRKCGNWEHLREITHSENCADNAQSRRTHCINGHEFTPSNTKIVRRGKYEFRRCRACDVVNNRRAWLKRKEAKL